ncbi:hypothetical protein SteCoe_7909 [Stentor coeruleus]|uniref:Uncharacterized protein n=1 Tax=Stentor coeruleus TaxID=5963 RepID=A0A1R2CLD6_9CILI|nr:hypothetical protein SteCoe_7909 [Stentor coeruleus]
MEEHQDNFSLLFNPRNSSPNKEASFMGQHTPDHSKQFNQNKRYFEELTPIENKKGFQSIQIPHSSNNESSLGTELIFHNYRKAAQQATLLISELKATIEYKKSIIALTQEKNKELEKDLIIERKNAHDHYQALISCEKFSSAEIDELNSRIQQLKKDCISKDEEIYRLMFKVKTLQENSISEDLQVEDATNEMNIMENYAPDSFESSLSSTNEVNASELVAKLKEEKEKYSDLNKQFTELWIKYSEIIETLNIAKEEVALNAKQLSAKNLKIHELGECIEGFKKKVYGLEQEIWDCKKELVKELKVKPPASVTMSLHDLQIELIKKYRDTVKKCEEIENKEKSCDILGINGENNGGGVEKQVKKLNGEKDLVVYETKKSSLTFDT